MVSIIIINYNTFQLTCNCITSIVEKTKQVAYEIILVDNNSAECDPDEFRKLFPDIILVKNKTNVGFSKGNNIGIEKANGQYILLLNSDTELQNNAVKIVYEFLKKHPQVAAASSKLVFPNGEIQHCCQRFPSVWYNIIEFSRLHKLMSEKSRARLFFGSYFDHESYAEPDWIWGTFFMFPKSVLSLLKGKKLNDDFFMYTEDMQWCFDFRELGFKIAYVPEAIAIHHMRGSSGNASGLIQKNHNLFLKNNYNLIHYLLLKK